MVFLSAANPMGAHYSHETDELLWFLVISDTHIGAQIGYGDKDTERLHWATSELVDTVLPSFLVNAGDLTDATGGLYIPTGQKDKEWQSYRDICVANGMTPEFYYDLPGNHDQYSQWPTTHYLGYSIQGAASGQINHSWTRVDTTGQKYLFIGLATCGSDGAIPPFDNAGLDTADLAFLHSTLSAHGDADIIIMFGHHPIDRFKHGESQFRQVLEDHNVLGYYFGHTHKYSMAWENGALQFNLDSLTKGDKEHVALVALDGMGLSTRVFDVYDWPQVLITTPLNAQLAQNHLYDYMISNALPTARVRALALHPNGIASVQAFINGSIPVTMELVEDNVWQGEFDPTLLDPDTSHLVEVVAVGGGKTRTDRAVFYVFDDPDPIDPVEPNPEESPDYVEEPFRVEEVEPSRIEEPTNDLGSSDVVSLDSGWGFEEIRGQDSDEDTLWPPEELAPGEVSGTGDALESDGETPAQGEIPLSSGPKSGCSSSPTSPATYPAGWLWLALLGLACLAGLRIRCRS
jgi:hypothetical protein